MVGIDGFSFRFQKWTLEEEIQRTSGMGFGSLSIDLAENELNPESARELSGFASTKNVGLTVALSAIVPRVLSGEGVNRQVATLKQQIAIASQLSVRTARTYILDTDSPFTLQEHVFEIAKAVVREILPYAQDAGLRLGIENHRDFKSTSLTRFIEMVASPDLGVYFDLGNQLPILESPLEAFEELKPYIIAAHIKDAAIKTEANGFLWRSVPLGMGALPIDEMVSMIKRHGNIETVLEISTSRSPTFTRYAAPTAREGVEFGCRAFVEKYARWPAEVDTYQDRGVARNDVIAKQDLRHIEQSLRWYKSHIAE